MHEITYRTKSFYDDLADQKGKHVHLILIATKPDIIKQVPLYLELQKRKQCVLLGHTGQHYDENLSGGMLKEFGGEPDFNLNVRGQMHEVVSQIIGGLGFVIGEIKGGPARRSPRKADGGGKIVIPYVHGDTTTAMAASNAAFCCGFSSVHVEAGLRTLTPRYWKSEIRNPKSETFSDFVLRASDFAAWRQFLMDPKNWGRGSLEPYPEQFNTRCAEAGSGIHLAPGSLNRDFMLSEGFPEDRIFVTGNSVADALRLSLDKLGFAQGKPQVFE